MRSWWRDPLLHCLAIGTLLFLVYARWFAEPVSDPRTIRVTQQDLIGFVEQRSKALDKQTALRRLQAMTTQARADLIEDYIREEAMFRTAQEWGLGKDDYVIRRRMAQKVDFLSEGLDQSEPEISEDALLDYYRENAQRYTRPAVISFTHVFIRNRADAAARAQSILKVLNDNQVPFSAATAHGERFLYHTNYLEKNKEEISAHFGAQMADRLFQATPAQTEWQGPLESDHGWHVVLLVKHAQPFTPKLNALRAELERDLAYDRVRKRKQTFTNNLVNGFDVIIDLADYLSERD